jgi:ribonuclease J
MMSAQWGDLAERIADGRIVFQKIHASGHATPDDLSQFIHRINPKHILPIHTLNPSWFEQFGSEKVIGRCDGF